MTGFIAQAIRDPRKTFEEVMEEAANVRQEDLEKELRDASSPISRQFHQSASKVFSRTYFPLFRERVLPGMYLLETRRLVSDLLRAPDSEAVYRFVRKHIEDILQGHKKPLFVPFEIGEPSAPVIEHLRLNRARSALEELESIPFDSLVSYLPDDNVTALIHLITTNTGIYGIITQRDVTPEIVSCDSFNRQKVENILRGWMWLYYWHREDLYTQSAERIIQQRKMSLLESEGFKEAHQRIPYEKLFNSQPLFDNLQPTEIPTADGIPIIPFPSWLLMEAILRELGKGDFTSGEGLWQKIDKNLQQRNIKRVILCPDQALTLFPHHGAILNIDRNGQKEYLLDRYEIAYLPLGTISKVVPATHNPRRVLVFGTDGEELSGVGISNLASFFPEHISEWHASEGREKLAESLSHVNALTFIGHGRYDWEVPSLSYLGTLSDGKGGINDLISLKSLISIMPFQLNVIILAGCETGLPKITTKVTDYKGFAEDLFSHRNISAIISTLWPVPQISTVLLMGQFHKYWLLGDTMEGKKQLAPAKALRKAQLWLSSLTRERAIVELQTLASIHPSAKITKEIQLLDGSIVERPYAHPYFWSTFYVMGGVSWIH
jgi:CHAT domain-containing protein